jgi:SAM-dependent methyltransferase
VLIEPPAADDRQAITQVAADILDTACRILGDVRAIEASPAAAPHPVPEMARCLETTLRVLQRAEEALRDWRARADVEASAWPDPLYVHLGRGGERLTGWVHLDWGSSRVPSDVRWPLPFRTGTVALVYAADVLGSPRPGDAPDLLREIARILEPGGVVRLVLPLPEGPRIGDSRHDWEMLRRMLVMTGFRSVERRDFMASAHAALRVDVAGHAGPSSLFVEATR